jgi:hypothetical protein
MAYWFYMSHLEVEPITGRERFSIVSTKQIQDLSQLEFQAVNHSTYFHRFQFLVNHWGTDHCSALDMHRVRRPHWTHQTPVLRSGETGRRSFTARQQALAADLYENMDNNRFGRSEKYERVRVTCESQNVWFNSRYDFIYFLLNFLEWKHFCFYGHAWFLINRWWIGSCLGSWDIPLSPRPRCKL